MMPWGMPQGHWARAQKGYHLACGLWGRKEEAGPKGSHCPYWQMLTGYRPTEPLTSSPRDWFSARFPTAQWTLHPSLVFPGSWEMPQLGNTSLGAIPHGLGKAGFTGVQADSEG